MGDLAKNLLLFFDRPMEPIFMEKGDNKTLFKIPEKYIPDEYKDLVKSLTPRIKAIRDKVTKMYTTSLPTDFDQSIIEVKEIKLPDLSLLLRLRKDGYFSFFIPSHREMAGKLIDIFMNALTVEELQYLLAYCHLRINPYMFNYCMSVAILHRPDTRGITIPPFAETFPDKFVDRQSMRRAREYCAIAAEGAEIPVVKIELPVNPRNPEQRLAYFREDVGVNSHHWHWHLIYPTDTNNKVIVCKDRRGELFYYMHHQIMNRYNVERMCNGLARTQPYKNFREPIAEGYFPFLDSVNSSRGWAPRFDNIAIYNIDRPSHKVKASIDDMELWQERILAAVESQSIQQTNGSLLPLDEETGIDILGNLIEATMISENPIHYGDYHNKGHMLIAFIHDPQGYHEQENSVMGDSGTAMRDPVFYRWHAHINDIFMSYKNKLTPYGLDKLVFPGITVRCINIEGVSGKNTINTLWQRSTINVKNGLDFARRRDVFVQFTHLQHEEFDYVIEVSNSSFEAQVGTFRIFMAPTVDENGKPLSFEDQRNLMIEFDKFSHPLSTGLNTIRRKSVNSSVTIPFERIFRDRRGKCNAGVASGLNYCDCGWPQYLLVPKGTTEGFPMVVFVMISNWKEDKVQQDLVGANNDNASYCGLRDQKYPDRRPMGFPFDRKAAPGVDSLYKFLQSNMAIRNCTIKFTGETRDREPIEEEKPQQSQESGEKDPKPSNCGRPGTDSAHGNHPSVGGSGCDRPAPQPCGRPGTDGSHGNHPNVGGSGCDRPAPQPCGRPGTDGSHGNHPSVGGSGCDLPAPQPCGRPGTDSSHCDRSGSGGGPHGEDAGNTEPGHRHCSRDGPSHHNRHHRQC